MLKTACLLGLLLSGSVLAAPIIKSSTPIGSSIVTLDEFGILPVDTPITTQFAAFGVTFSSSSGLYANPEGGPATFLAANGFDVGNYIGNYQYNGGAFIEAPNSQQTTIQFAGPVSAASFALGSNAGATQNTAVFTAFLGSTLVETFNSGVGVGTANYYGFQSIVFDRIVVDQTYGGLSNDSIYDNFSFTLVTNGTPEIDPAGCLGPIFLLSGLLATLQRRRTT